MSARIGRLADYIGANNWRFGLTLVVISVIQLGLLMIGVAPLLSE
jgi:hypothetical protein